MFDDEDADPSGPGRPPAGPRGTGRPLGAPPSSGPGGRPPRGPGRGRPDGPGGDDKPSFGSGDRGGSLGEPGGPSPEQETKPAPADLFGDDKPAAPGPRRGPAGRPGRPGSGPAGPGGRLGDGPDRRPGASPVGLIDDDPDDGPDGEDTSWFTGFGELDGEPTPALLAAKAEPLGNPGPPPGRPGGKRSARPAGKPGARPAGPQARAGGRRKPKEPSKALLALGAVAVLASGLGAAYLFSNLGDEDQGNETTASTAVDGAATSVPDPGMTSTTTPGDTAAGPATDATPAIKFDEAAVGPLNADTPYTIQVVFGPEGAQYQLLVDDVPQAEPAAELAPVVFTAGLHQIAVDVITPAGTTTIPPAVVYAVGQVAPTPTFWANLSSVAVNDPAEGWGEAVRRFEEFVAAGHTDLKLLPSDWFPSLPAGYWMLYVDGFASSADATAYCEAHGLTPPDQCFARNFDPNAPAGG